MPERGHQHCVTPAAAGPDQRGSQTRCPWTRQPRGQPRGWGLRDGAPGPHGHSVGTPLDSCTDREGMEKAPVCVCHQRYCAVPLPLARTEGGLLRSSQEPSLGPSPQESLEGKAPNGVFTPPRVEVGALPMCLRGASAAGRGRPEPCSYGEGRVSAAGSGSDAAGANWRLCTRLTTQQTQQGHQVGGQSGFLQKQ